MYLEEFPDFEGILLGSERVDSSPNQVLVQRVPGEPFRDLKVHPQYQPEAIYDGPIPPCHSY